MARIIRAVAAAGIVAGSVVAVSGCAANQLGSAGISNTDAYRIGCPVVDSVLATRSVADKAAVAGLKGLRSHADLDADSKQWVDAALRLLRSADPDKAPQKARSVVVDGCRSHGYALRNLKS